MWFKRTKKKQRRVNRYDLPLQGGCVVPQDFMFHNELERYARFLELTLRFYSYEHMTDVQADELRDRVDTHNDECARKSGPTANGGYETWIGSCRFDCGSAPCSCEHSYAEYTTLKRKWPGSTRFYSVKNIIETMESEHGN